MRYDKYHLNMHEHFVGAPHPLQALVVLEQADENEEPSLQPLDGAGAFQAVMAAIYRPELGLQFKEPRQLLRDCAHQLNRIKVYRYRRRWSLDALDAGLEPIFREIRRSPALDRGYQQGSQHL